ncbi:MAG: hypothetical protein Q8K63_06965 [Acidimicrobiales bacterium]|nr:hypothetical protein [Acidimicrobiales bacterium]
MPTAVIVAVGVGLVVVHLRASFRVSMATLVASTFLIPGALAFPGAPGTVLLVRIGLWTAALSVFARINRGEVAPSSIRPTRVMTALTIFVVLAYLLGVARGPFPSRPEVAFDLWLLIADQLLFLWVATVAVRTLGVVPIARMAVMAVGLASIIAIGERITHASYAHYWFQGSPKLVIAAQKLELRGSSVRVRGAADFALEFAWVLAYFMPFAGLFAIRAKRLVAFVVPLLIAVAMILTVTRSAFAGLGLGALMLAITARGNRRLLAALGVAGLLALVLYTSANAVRQPYQSADPESERVRARRLVLVTQEMAPRPWLGVGLDGLIQRGIKGTDNAALGMYAAVGVIGLGALAAAVGSAVATASYGAFKGDEELAPVAGAVLGGLGAGVLGMFAFDTFSAPITSWNFWLLAALGVGLYEEVRVRGGTVAPRPVRLTRDRLAVPLAGLVLGLSIFLLAPKHVAAEIRFFTLSGKYLSQSKKANDDYIGRVLVETVCDVGTRAVGSTIKVDCFDPLNFGPGTGVVRLQADSRDELRTALFRFGAAARRVPNTELTVTSPVPAPVSRPTWARTAPVVGLLLGAELALLLPGFPVMARRTRRRHPRSVTTTEQLAPVAG